MKMGGSWDSKPELYKHVEGATWSLVQSSSSAGYYVIAGAWPLSDLGSSDQASINTGSCPRNYWE
jgi:hypothetical protein